MMITIHGLPSSTNYQELKGLIRNISNLSDFILDELVPDGNGTNKVRVGLADEAEGNHLLDCLKGFRLRGNLLKAEPVRRTPRNQPKNNINLWASGHCPSKDGPGPSGDFGNQMGLPAGNNIAPWGVNIQGYQPQGPGSQILQNDFSHLYQQGDSQSFQQGLSRLPQQVSNKSIGAGPSNNYNISTRKNPGDYNNSHLPNPKMYNQNNSNAPKPKGPGPNNPNAQNLQGHALNNPNAPKLKGPGPFIANNSNAQEPNPCDLNVHGPKPNEPRRHNPDYPDPAKLTKRERKEMKMLRKQFHEQRIKREGYVPQLAGKGGLGTFGMPCQTLMRELRPSICLFTRGKVLTPERRRLMVVIKADTKRLLTKLVAGKGYLKTAQVVELYRQHYPIETDKEYVLRMQQGIRDGTMRSDMQMRQWKGPETRNSVLGDVPGPVGDPGAEECAAEGDSSDDWEYFEDSCDEG